MKPTLKGPGSGRLKLKCGRTAFNFAFKFNLRRYNQVDALRPGTLGATKRDFAVAGGW
jgi:hypothetical protein